MQFVIRSLVEQNIYFYSNNIWKTFKNLQKSLETLKIPPKPSNSPPTFHGSTKKLWTTGPPPKSRPNLTKIQKTSKFPRSKTDWISKLSWKYSPYRRNSKSILKSNLHKSDLLPVPRLHRKHSSKYADLRFHSRALWKQERYHQKPSVH